MIELTDECRVAVIWFMEVNNKTGNLLAVVMHDGDGHWYGRYRFRWYRDRLVFDSDDKRSWYKITAKEPEAARDEMVLQLDNMFRLPGERESAQFERLEINGDGTAAAHALEANDWAHRGLDTEA